MATNLKNSRNGNNYSIKNPKWQKIDIWAEKDQVNIQDHQVHHHHRFLLHQILRVHHDRIRNPDQDRIQIRIPDQDRIRIPDQDLIKGRKENCAQRRRRKPNQV